MEVKFQGQTMRAEIGGELDHHRAEGIRAKLDGAFDKSACRHIVFDFSKVTFMDSSGIGMVIGRYKKAEERGGKCAIVGMNGEMMRLYKISGLQKIVGSYASLDEAERAMGGGGLGE